MASVNARLFVAAVMVSVSSLVFAQKEAIEGIRNFTKVDVTFACAGATESTALAGLAKRGYKAVINLREATEAGNDVDASQKAADAAGMKYIHLPFSGSKPDEAVVDRFLAAIKDPSNQPTFMHCASGSRAAALWMIKRMLIDGWDEEKASSEALSLGLSSPTLKTFALDYVKKHK